MNNQFNFIVLWIFMFFMINNGVYGIIENNHFFDWYEIHGKHEIYRDHKLKDIHESLIDNDKYINYINSQKLDYVLEHNMFSGFNNTKFGDHIKFTPLH